MKRITDGALVLAVAITAGSCDRTPPRTDPSGPSFSVEVYWGVTIQPRPPANYWDVVTPACKNYTATVTDENGNPVPNPTLLWIIGDSRVAYFSNNSSGSWTGTGAANVCGKVQGTNQGYGYTDLSARWTAPDGGIAEELLLIENGQTTSGYAPTTLTVAPASKSLLPGGSATLTATGTDQFGHTRHEKPVWTSNNTNIATVSTDAQTGDATVTGVAYGSATVTANVNGTTRDVPITVIGATSIEVYPPVRTSICQNGSGSLLATVRDQNGNEWTPGIVSWSTSNANIATVAPPGGPSNPGARIAYTAGVSVGFADVTASFAGATGPLNAVVTIKVNDCAPTVTVGGPYTLNMYTTGRYTAVASQGAGPYTYEFRRQDCPQYGNCFPYSSWVARGSTNYWDTIVYSCGVYRINVQARATDSRGYVSQPSGPWTTAINNPC